MKNNNNNKNNKNNNSNNKWHKILNRIGRKNNLNIFGIEIIRSVAADLSSTGCESFPPDLISSGESLNLLGFEDEVAS